MAPDIEAGFVAPLARDVVVVAGPDAASFLEGQLSQTVADLAEGASTRSFLLQPQGKVDAWLRVTRMPAGAFALDVEAGFGAAVVARLRRFMLRVDLELTELPAPDHTALAVRGPGSATMPIDAEAPLLRAELALPGHEGVDVFATGAIAHPDGLAIVGADDLETWRIERGIPAMGAEISETVIPAELGQWLVDASVSFTKGCFTGQELVARIDSRGGNVARRLRGLVLDAPVSPGAEVVVGDGVVGTVTSVAVSPTLGPVALAFVHRSVDPPVPARVDDARGELRALPLVGPPSVPPAG